MRPEPFTLNDRITPDGDNDLEVVKQLDRSLDRVLGTRAPERPRPQRDVIRRLRS